MNGNDSGKSCCSCFRRVLKLFEDTQPVRMVPTKLSDILSAFCLLTTEWYNVHLNKNLPAAKLIPKTSGDTNTDCFYLLLLSARTKILSCQSQKPTQHPLSPPRLTNRECFTPSIDIRLVWFDEKNHLPGKAFPPIKRPWQLAQTLETPVRLLLHSIAWEAPHSSRSIQMGNIFIILHPTFHARLS